MRSPWVTTVFASTIAAAYGFGERYRLPIRDRDLRISDLGTIGGAEPSRDIGRTVFRIAGSGTTSSGDEHAFEGNARGIRISARSAAAPAKRSRRFPAGERRPCRSSERRLHAFLVDFNQMIDLGLGGSKSYATSANINRVVVGASLLPGDVITHAFIRKRHDDRAPRHSGGLTSLTTSTSTARSSAAQRSGDSRTMPSSTRTVPRSTWVTRRNQRSLCDQRRRCRGRAIAAGQRKHPCVQASERCDAGHRHARGTIERGSRHQSRGRHRGMGADRCGRAACLHLARRHDGRLEHADSAGDRLGTRGRDGDWQRQPGPAGPAAWRHRWIRTSERRNAFVRAHAADRSQSVPAAARQPAGHECSKPSRNGPGGGVGSQHHKFEWLLRHRTGRHAHPRRTGRVPGCLD